MPKKNFKTNVTEDFFADAKPEEASQEEAQIEYRSLEKAKQLLPPGYSITKENKTERLQLLVRPATKEGLKKIAKAKGNISINELANIIFEEFIERIENE